MFVRTNIREVNKLGLSSAGTRETVAQLHSLPRSWARVSPPTPRKSRETLIRQNSEFERHDPPLLALDGWSMRAAGQLNRLILKAILQRSPLRASRVECAVTRPSRWPPLARQVLTLLVKIHVRSQAIPT